MYNMWRRPPSPRAHRKFTSRMKRQKTVVTAQLSNKVAWHYILQAYATLHICIHKIVQIFYINTRPDQNQLYNTYPQRVDPLKTRASRFQVNLDYRCNTSQGQPRGDLEQAYTTVLGRLQLTTRVIQAYEIFQHNDGRLKYSFRILLLYEIKYSS